MATGDILYSGWGTLTTYMGSSLNSLANNTTNVCASILDNTSSKHHHIASEIVLASADLSAQTGLTVELYLIPSIDGTNYCDTGSDASTTDLPPGSAHVGTFYVQKTATSHRAGLVCKECLQELKYKPVLINKTGAAFAASGNTLKIKTNSDQVAS